MSPPPFFNIALVLRDAPQVLRDHASTIQEIQARLGTAQEQPGDVEALRNAAHQYMNKLTEYYGARQLSEPPFVTLFKQTHKTT